MFEFKSLQMNRNANSAIKRAVTAWRCTESVTRTLRNYSRSAHYISNFSLHQAYSIAQPASTSGTLLSSIRAWPRNEINTAIAGRGPRCSRPGSIFLLKW